MTGARTVFAGLAAAALAAAASGAFAQGVLQPGVPPQQPTLILRVEPPLSQRAHDPLTPEELGTLRRARALRENGKLPEAQREMLGLQRARPRHPLVLAELAQVMLRLGDHAGVEKLARMERWTQKDSLLLARELVEAAEHLGHAQRAIEAIVEAWTVEPGIGDWATTALVRLDAADAGAAARLLRRAVRGRPERVDLARTLARLEYANGNERGMLDVIRAADREGTRPPLRWQFAEELLRSSLPADSAAAIAALMDLTGDASVDAAYRSTAARRAWALYEARGDAPRGAARIAEALADLPSDRWEIPFLVEVARVLRETGETAAARRLTGAFAGRAATVPELAIERALADLRDGPPERAFASLEEAARLTPEGRFHLAEALFFAGRADSALGLYRAVSENPRDRRAGAALERMYLIEDARPREALAPIGRVTYEAWRGEHRRAAALADSLYRALPRGELWAFVAITLAEERRTLGDARAALEPLLALADELPEARLASLARQRAGDAYLALGEDASALAQYEECLARYPRAWNAPEVRRKVQELRRERRF